ncbi:hypothetical protein H8356DRAFT_1338480, partial [Neocallimastix lanati (nom. inval.)]
MKLKDTLPETNYMKTNINYCEEDDNISEGLYDTGVNTVKIKLRCANGTIISNAFLNGIYVSQDRLLYSNSTTKIILIGYRVIIDADDYICSKIMYPSVPYFSSNDHHFLLLSKILEIWHRRQVPKNIERKV